MRWYRMATVLAGVTFTVLGSACSSSTHHIAQTPTVRVRARVTTTTATSGFVLGNARASFIPAGFVAVRTLRGAMPGRVVGPVPGATMDGQQFENSRQQFVVAVHRGEPLRVDPWMRLSNRRVHGCRTYVGTFLTGEREISWAVNMTTSGFVGGSGMSDATLFEIADGLTIPTN